MDKTTACTISCEREGDAATIGAHANGGRLSPQGRPVTGVVCSGPAKGHTVRFD